MRTPAESRERNMRQDIAYAQEARRWLIENLLPILREHGTWMLLTEAVKPFSSTSTSVISDKLKHATTIIHRDTTPEGSVILRAFDCNHETVGEWYQRTVLMARVGRCSR